MQSHELRDVREGHRRSPSAVVPPVTLDVRHLDPAVRAESVRELMWKQVVRVEIDHHPRAELIDFRGSVLELGRVRVCSIDSNATTVRRTMKLAQDNMVPSLFLGLQVAESSMVIQDGRHAVLQPGDLAVYDTTRPYTLLNENGIHQHLFRIPLAELALPPKFISQITAVRLTTDSPIGDLAAGYFQRLATHVTPPDLREAVALEQPSIELLRALLTIQLGDRPPNEPREASLQVSILNHAREHLADPNLSPELIAHHHNISVRQLYKVLASSDISLGAWIRTQRLEECRKDLSKPAAKYLTIAALARRWGFDDATYFGRVFKQAYGMPPSDWRRVRKG